MGTQVSLLSLSLFFCRITVSQICLKKNLTLVFSVLTTAFPLVSSLVVFSLDLAIGSLQRRAQTYGIPSVLGTNALAIANLGVNTAGDQRERHKDSPARPA